MRYAAAAAAFFAVIAFAGCDGCTTAGADGLGEGEGEGNGEGEGEAGDVVALRIEPADVTLVTDGLTLPTQAFTVIAVDAAGDERDVTTAATIGLSNADLGSVVGATFTSAGIGGRSDVVARFGDELVRATLLVRVETAIVGDGNSGGAGSVTDDADSLFDDVDVLPVDDTRAPDLVYPNSGVLLPRNLGVIEVQWRKGRADNSLFAVTFKSPAMNVRVLTRCVNLNGGCVYSPSPAMWRLLAETHAGTDAVDVTVQATDDAGTSIGRSNGVQIFFAATGVKGGLYYWTTSGSTAIMRVDFGATQQVPEKFFPFAGNECFGCHALSPDGRKMSLSKDGQGAGQLGLINIVDGTERLGFTNDQREQFQSWNGSSSLFAAMFGDTNDLAVRHQLRIRSGDDASIVERIDLDHEPTHPDWSPVEDRISYTRVTHHQTSQRPGRSGINSLKKINGSWGAPVELVAAETGKNRYSPATAPGGEYLAYIESTCSSPEREYGGECDGDADPTGRMFATDFAGRSGLVQLDNANAPGRGDGDETRLSNSFPKWSPFSEPRFKDGTGRVHWMTFSSRRAYGLRTTNPEDGRQLLWMVAVDPDRIAVGADGSYPAFALPFQDIDTSNHMAQWTREFVEAGCSELNVGCTVGADDACCGTAVCTPAGDGSLAGTCQPPPDDGETCSAVFTDCSERACCADAGICSTTSEGSICILIGG